MDKEKITTRVLTSDQQITVQPPPLPEHLIELPGNRWAVWRCVGLRGAGFPASHVLQLATPGCAMLADQLLQAKTDLASTRSAALDALHQTLSKIDVDSAQRKAVKKVLRRISKNKVPESLESLSVEKAAIKAFCQAHAKADATQAEFEQAFDAAILRTSQAIYQVANSNQFCEAVTWQNRSALQTGINFILRKPPGTSHRDKKQRQREELITNYVQRYCVKNDTIGFFGPVGWAKFVSQQDTLDVRFGVEFLARRKVYFEGWCIDTLAAALGRNKALLPWVAPRRRPSIYLDGTTLYQPFKAPVEIPAAQAAVLQVCNGEQTAREIAQQLIHTPCLGIGSEAKVYDLIEQLNHLGLIVWTLETPLETYPERTLRRLLERIEDKHLRQLNLRALDVLEKARNGVAQAAGDAKKLERALNALDTVFTRLTGASSTRADGKTYAARTIVYEDCLRDVEVDIGPQILQALGPSLSLLLESARWFTVQASAVYRQIINQTFTEMASQAGSSIVPLVNVWPRLQSILYGEGVHPLDSLCTAFQKRWSHILSFPDQARRAEYNSKALQPHVLAAFASPQPGWTFTRCHTPDVMIAASSVQAIQKGDYQLVMGELHMGRNTLGASLFLAQHPSPTSVLEALAAEQPQPRPVLVPPKEWFDLTARTRMAFVLPYDFYLLSTSDPSDNPTAQTLPIGAMVIEDAGDGLVVRTRDGRLRFDVIEFISDLIVDQVINYFKILSPAPHTPRVTIDRLVVCRETWRFPAQELTFAYEKTESKRFITARRWAQNHRIPRFAFVKTPIERKPFYVDFDSPIFVNILAKYIRRTKEQDSTDAQITVTEMLPDPSQVWLPDAEGQRYTSEFRIVAIDCESIRQTQ